MISAVEKDGGFVLRDLITADPLHRLNEEIDPELMKISPGSKRADEDQYLNQDFHEARTMRLTRLLSFSPSLPDVLEYPFVQAMIGATLLRHCASVWLTSAQVSEIGPGVPAQPLHLDIVNWAPLLMQSGQQLLVRLAGLSRY